jgi:hypothetical protein
MLNYLQEWRGGFPDGLIIIPPPPYKTRTPAAMPTPMNRGTASGNNPYLGPPSDCPPFLFTG